MTHRLAIVGISIGVLTLRTAFCEDLGLEKRGREILEELVVQPWARDWQGATLVQTRLVSQKSDLARPTGLPPVWYAGIKGPGEKTGYLMWESKREGRLLEFCLDAPLVVDGGSFSAISGVPPLQQFALKEKDGSLVASGCVPTSAASVVSFWTAGKYPQWRGKEGTTDAGIATRLRSRLKMTSYKDTDGFTANGMALAGAFPREMCRALRDDAQAHEVEMTFEIAPFGMDAFREEIEEARPVLVSCVVRVPHKPELSWGHAIAGVGWGKLDGIELVGVLDNFYPTKTANAIRWIRGDAFRSMITLRPGKAE